MAIQRPHARAVAAVGEKGATKYLYDEVDFDDRDIREMKLTLKVMHRVGVGSVLLIGVVMTGTIALFIFLASD